MSGGVWTNNWKSLRNAFLCGDYIVGLSALKKFDGTLVETVSPILNNHANLILRSPMGYAAALPEGGGTMDRICPLLGTDSTPPAASDYALTTSDSIRILTVANEKPTWSTATGEVSNTVKVTVQNNGAEAVTLSEWGLVFTPGLTYASNRVLLYRELLASPVTLQPNQAATLTLTRSITLTDPSPIS